MTRQAVVLLLLSCVVISILIFGWFVLLGYANTHPTLFLIAVACLLYPAGIVGPVIVILIDRWIRYLL